MEHTIVASALHIQNVTAVIAVTVGPGLFG